MLKPSEYKFRSSDKVGFAEAEQDRAFLVSCFVDNGQYEDIVKGDLNNHIILGRTGAGKTALIERISELQANVVQLDPEQLAFNHLTNSTILQFLIDLDLDLDLFFGLFWRHVIVVEVLRRRYKIRDAQTKQQFFRQFQTLFQSPQQQRALEYLDQWGGSFWLNTDERVREFTSKIENDVKLTAGAGFQGLIAKLENGSTVTQEEKQEYKERIQRLINDVQVQELANIIDLLASILDDPQNKYFVLVDHLDEKWVDDRFKTRLIRALLEASRKFLRVRNLRIVIALRFDLYDRVLADTRRSSQQQEEKLHSLISSIRWTRDQLTNLLDKRIDRLVKQRYTTRPVTLKDILPASMLDRGTHRKGTIDWILDRTFMRPRDFIQFINIAIARSVAIAQSINEPVISEAALSEASGEYSRDRLNAIADEYSVTYPNLLNFVEVLYEKPERFPLSAISDMVLLTQVQSALGACNGTMDKLRDWAHDFTENRKSLVEFRRDLFYVFYEVGIVGLQKAPHEQISWTYESRLTLSRAEITPETRVRIHPMLWRRLGIRPQEPLLDDIWG